MIDRNCIFEAVLNAVDHGARACCLPCMSTLVAAEENDDDEEEEELDYTPVNDCGGNPEMPRASALRMDCASCYLPDHGDDAHFIDAEAGFVGVADGVGSCRDRGVDASAFARALMKHASAGAKRPRRRSPYDLLARAHAKAARAGTPGASTALVVSLRGATLEWACVGDSAFAVLRGGRIVHRSTPQQHRFNCPYQLASTKGDRVEDAAVGVVPVAEGDVVVIATDGLFDNVFDVELEWMVRDGAEKGLSPQELADRIAVAARKLSEERMAHSPFSIECWKDCKGDVEYFHGGKVDDITVVVAVIVLSDL